MPITFRDKNPYDAPSNAKGLLELVLDIRVDHVDVSYEKSTVGTNEEEVPGALVKFLRFVAANLDTCDEDYDDPFVRQLQNSVRKISLVVIWRPAICYLKK